MRFIIHGLNAFVPDFLRYFSKDNDVIIIDEDEGKLEHLEQIYDIQTLCGQFYEESIQSQVYIDQEETIILAMTPFDEKNLLIGGFASYFEETSAIVCVHQPISFNKKALYKDSCKVSFFSITEEFSLFFEKIMTAPSFVFSLMNGQARVFSVTGKQLKDQNIDQKSMRPLCVLKENGQMIFDIPHLKPQDRMFFLLEGKDQHIKTDQKIAFLGSRGVSSSLFSCLEKKGASFCVIEDDTARLKKLSLLYPNITLMQSHRDIAAFWRSFHLEVDWLVCMQETDSANILDAAIGKVHHIPRVLACVNLSMAQFFNIDVLFSPALCLLNAVFKKISPPYVKYWCAVEGGCFIEIKIKAVKKDWRGLEKNYGWRFLMHSRKSNIRFDRAIFLKEKDHVVFWVEGYNCQRILEQLYEFF